MRSPISRHAWRYYTTLALIAFTGALSAVFCTLLILAESFFRLFIMIGLFIFGIGALVVDYFQKHARHV